MSTVRLHHGTDLASAQDLLVNGVNAARAAQYNGAGEFWASTDRATADWFALVNPANGAPARFSFDLAEEVLQVLLSTFPAVVRMHGGGIYEFLPSGFPLLNRHMSGKQVVAVV